MTTHSNRLPRQAGLIIMGIALILVGIPNSNAFYGAGALFVLAGVAAIIRQRSELRASADETDESPDGTSS